MVEDRKDLHGALDEAINHKGPGVVNVGISQGSACELKQLRFAR